MLLQNLDLNNNKANEKLRLPNDTHISSWEYYCDCYYYTLKTVLQTGLRRHYAFNCRGRALLFLIRHYFELCLKKNLELKGSNVPNTHDLNELVSLFNTYEVPIEFKNAILKFSCDTDGACFRYYLSKKTGNPYFKIGDDFRIADILKMYNSLESNETFKAEKICEWYDYEDVRIKWDLTLHMGECEGLGQIRTQYDSMIEMIIEGIISGEFIANKMYIPLLFLIRHSIEIALKFNITEARKLTDIVDQRSIEEIHSLEKLFNLFCGDNGYIKKLETSKLDPKTKDILENYIIQYTKLSTIIHQMDVNSLAFRFPITKSGEKHKLNMNSKSLIKVLELYQKTDPFLTFTNEVLKEQGIL